MKYKLAKSILILCILMFIFAAPLCNLIGVDLKVLRENSATVPLIFNGVCMAIIGILGIIFRNEYGMWSANYRKRLANKHPMWKRMSGLPEKKVQYYLSIDFNRRMVIIGAVILIVVGVLLAIAGLFL